MVRIVKKIEISIPDGTKNRYPEGMLKGSCDCRVWYPVIAEKTVSRKKRDSDEIFEDFQFGIILKTGFIAWVSSYTVIVREDTKDINLQLVQHAMDTLGRMYPSTVETVSIQQDEIFGSDDGITIDKELLATLNRVDVKPTVT